ncbi:hypothetical protein BJ944DRAFT_72937 [Cunninghamella echinulata]|nr:hypothetical protein BJ944DRAFT_72937 [Cunninghamella echinulata]
MIVSKYVDLFFLCCLHFITIRGQSSNVQTRLNPGCALIQSTIYCFGGNTRLIPDGKGEEFAGAPINEHIALDLDQFGDNFSRLNYNNVQWSNVSNTIDSTLLEPIGYQSATTLFSDNSYIIYGGYPVQSTKSLDRPFLHYNPKTDTWKQLSLLNGNNYTTQAPILNLGNDTIWTYGGYINNTKTDTVEVINNFDYKTLKWMSQTPFSGPLGIDYTATLAYDNVIYIIGGVFKRSGLITQTTFDYITIFDTQKLSWDNFRANGSDPTPRVGHSTIEVPNKKLLIVYGGRRYGSTVDSKLNDYYYVYDIARRVFTPCGAADKTKTRFGHFAALYKSRYLLLSFGYVNRNRTADSLTVIDVDDPYIPVWLSGISNDNETNSNNEMENKVGLGPILDLGKLIPAIVVPIVAAILVMCWYRYFLLYQTSDS